VNPVVSVHGDNTVSHRESGCGRSPGSWRCCGPDSRSQCRHERRLDRRRLRL